MNITRIIFAFRSTIIVFSVTLHAQSSTQPPPTAKDTVKLSYEDEVNAAYNRRIAALRRPQGWPSLVALDWLKEGENNIESIGTIILTKGVARFNALPDVQTKIGGKLFTSGALRIEGGKERPDRVELGSKIFTIIKRGERYAMHVGHQCSNTQTLHRH